MIYSPIIECIEEATWENQIVSTKDKLLDSSSLQAPLWRNDELSEYQQEFQLSLTKVSILQGIHTKMSKDTCMI